MSTSLGYQATSTAMSSSWNSTPGAGDIVNGMVQALQGTFISNLVQSTIVARWPVSSPAAVSQLPGSSVGSIQESAYRYLRKYCH